MADQGPATTPTVKPSKKRFIAPLLVVLFLVGVGVYAYWERQNNAVPPGFQATVDQELKDKGCTKDVLKDLHKAYPATDEKSAQRAKRAEQIANCEALVGTLQTSQEWYHTAESDYKAAGDSKKAADMTAIITNYENLSKIPKAKPSEGSGTL